MKIWTSRLRSTVAYGLAAAFLSVAIGCVSRSRVALLVKADPATARAKLAELSAQTGGTNWVPSSLPLTHQRFVILDANWRLRSLHWHTEVEVVPYGKVQTLLRARTGEGINSSFVSGDLASESEVLRMCADYIERGVKPAGQQVIPFEIWQLQTRTNQFVPRAIP